MKNWIQDDADEDINNYCGDIGEGSDEDNVDTATFDQEFADHLVDFEGNVTEASPVHPDIEVRKPKLSIESSSSGKDHPPTLPMMLRQEERPKKKRSLGAKAQPMTPQIESTQIETQIGIDEVISDNPLSIFSPSSKRENKLDIADDTFVSPSSEFVNKNDVLPKSAETVIDGSVLGDYCHWTAGDRLTASGVRTMYSGLYATALDEAEAGIGGKRISDDDCDAKSTSDFATPSKILASNAATPNSSGIAGLAGTAASYLPLILGGMRGAGNLTSPEPYQSNQPVTSIQGNTATSQPQLQAPEQVSGNKSLRRYVRSVRVLEVVMRPDVSLKEIMTICYKISKVACLRYSQFFRTRI